MDKLGKLGMERGGVGWEYFMVGRGKRIIVRKGREEVRTVFFVRREKREKFVFLRRTRKEYEKDYARLLLTRSVAVAGGIPVPPISRFAGLSGNSSTS